MAAAAEAAAGVSTADAPDDEKNPRCIHTCTRHGLFTRRAYATAHNRHAKLHAMCEPGCAGFPDVQADRAAAAVDAAFEQAQTAMHFARQRAWMEQVAMLSPMLQWVTPLTPVAVAAAQPSEPDQPFAALMSAASQQKPAAGVEQAAAAAAPSTVKLCAHGNVDSQCELCNEFKRMQEKEKQHIDIVCEHDNVGTECWRCRDVFEVMEALKKKKKKEEECQHHPVVRNWCGCEQKKNKGGIRVLNTLYKREDVVCIRVSNRDTSPGYEKGKVIEVVLPNRGNGNSNPIERHSFSTVEEMENAMKEIQAQM